MWATFNFCPVSAPFSLFRARGSERKAFVIVQSLHDCTILLLTTWLCLERHMRVLCKKSTSTTARHFQTTFHNMTFVQFPRRLWNCDKLTVVVLTAIATVVAIGRTVRLGSRVWRAVRQTSENKQQLQQGSTSNIGKTRTFLRAPVDLYNFKCIHVHANYRVHGLLWC